MDAFELLKKDHKKVSQLFEEIESASGKSKNQLFGQLKKELDVHAHVEEKIFYPALENKQESRDITLEAYEEHKVVKDLLAELAAGAPGDEWDAKLKVLKENVEHHVEEEEGELFDKAEDVLSEEQIERLGAEMEAEKAREQGRTPASRGASTKRPAAPATSRAAIKKSESPGVLKRLANFVGLGDSSSNAAKKSSTRSTKRAAGKKSSGTAKSSGSTKKAAKKGAAKTTRKKSGARKATKRQPSRTRKVPKKSPARAGARKKPSSRKR